MTDSGYITFIALGTLNLSVSLHMYNRAIKAKDQKHRDANFFLCGFLFAFGILSFIYTWS